MRWIDTGPYRFRLDCAPRPVLAAVDVLYGGAASSTEPSEPADFRVTLAQSALLRRLMRPQVVFRASGAEPFKPVPKSQAYPFLEWGMNWCISAHDFQRLLIHAAVLVRAGQALIFPASPGSGKSTLAAYLALNGWSLFSDEMALIDLQTLRVAPMYRPICLKNASIPLVRQWAPEALMTKPTPSTAKGEVSHLMPQPFACFRKLQPATVVGVVFPRFDAAAELEALEPAPMDTFRALAGHAFNYQVIGEPAFHALGRLVDATQHLQLRYRDVAAVESLLREVFAL